MSIVVSPLCSEDSATVSTTDRFFRRPRRGPNHIPALEVAGVPPRLSTSPSSEGEDSTWKEDGGGRKLGSTIKGLMSSYSV